MFRYKFDKVLRCTFWNPNAVKNILLPLLRVGGHDFFSLYTYFSGKGNASNNIYVYAVCVGLMLTYIVFLKVYFRNFPVDIFKENLSMTMHVSTHLKATQKYHTIYLFHFLFCTLNCIQNNM